jgi:hypothetical protein
MAHTNLVYLKNKHVLVPFPKHIFLHNGDTFQKLTTKMTREHNICRSLAKKKIHVLSWFVSAPRPLHTTPTKA